MGVVLFIMRNVIDNEQIQPLELILSPSQFPFLRQIASDTTTDDAFASLGRNLHKIIS